MDSSRRFGIYIHIPFCASKCPYCDFLSGPVEKNLRHTHLAALNREILQCPYRGSEVTSLYFGGGTPSELDIRELSELIETLTEVFSFLPDSEWTMECNPNSATRPLLIVARENGFNRVSLGAQSFRTKTLQRLGRAHSASDSLLAYRDVRRCGFENVNLDLIFGIPGQTITEWRQDLDLALSLEPEHFSLYALSIEPGTEFASMGLRPVNEELSADMFELAMEKTSQAGYQQYEISNYSKKDFECRHNLLYWRNGPYLGFGLGAVSYSDRVRWTNTANWTLYETSIANGRVARCIEEKLEGAEALAEEIMLRLRTRWGFSPKDLSDKYGCNFWELLGNTTEEFLNAGLLESFEENLRLTRKGVLLADQVCGTFLSRAKQ